MKPYSNPTAQAWLTDPRPTVAGFHRSLPGYEPTRLVGLPSLAAELGVASVHVKEESARFGLPAFKMLGASYAIARALSERVGSERVLPPAELKERLVDRPTLVARSAASPVSSPRSTVAVLDSPW